MDIKYLKKKRERKKNDNEEYKPSLIELEKKNKKKQQYRKRNNNENVTHLIGGGEGVVEMYVRPLDMEEGEEIYNKFKQGHTFVVINNSVVIESRIDENGNNKIVITPLKDYIFPEAYFKGVVATIPTDMNLYDIINKIKMDKGTYLPTTNSCYTTVEEILRIVKADEKIMDDFKKLAPEKNTMIDAYFKLKKKKYH